MAACAERGFIIDCGVKAYATQLVLDDGRDPSAGAWLHGEIALLVDHFLYMEFLGKVRSLPPLIYTWEILGIEVDVSPVISISADDPRYAGPDEGPRLISDPERERFASVGRTDAWSEDEQNSGSYRLRCRLLDAEPERSMRRSGRRRPYGPL